jgi:parvulin-like peptidyl-prolyl isomerase
MRLKPVIFLITAIGIIGGLSFLSGCGSLPDDAAASVDGDIITKQDVTDRIDALRKRYSAMVPSEDEGDLYTNFKRETADQLVREKLEQQEAEKKGITVTREEVQQRFEELADESFLGDVQAMINSYLEKGLTEEELYDDTSRAMIHEKVMADIGEDITVTEEDAQAYYDRNIGQYVQPERRQVRQIVTDSAAAAQEAVTKARAGETFVSLVSTYSTDSEAQAKKGALGLVSPGQLAPELDQVVFSLGATQISDPVNLGTKWYVLTVETIMPPINTTFESVKQEIMLLSGNQQFAERWRAYVEDIYVNSSIEFADEYDPQQKVEIEGQEQ